jgi:UDP:flavonoid glycosyltransferase YjiC (YdhE family)
MLVVPHAHDQPDNAARVVRLGVARSVLPRQYRGARAAKELERLLSDSSVAMRAAEAADVVRGEGGSEAAAAAIQHACATFVRGNANDPRHVSHKERLDA